jgi:hypothetical protein
MALDDRIRTSVNQALEALVSEMVSASQAEVSQAVSETEQRLQDEFNQKIAEFEESQRQQTADEVRAAVEAEAARVAAEAQTRFDAEVAAAVTAATAARVAEAEASMATLRAEAEEHFRTLQEQADQRLADEQQAFDIRLAAAVADAEARAAAAAEASLATAHAAEREFEMAGMTRLVESIRGLDGASSLSEVLDALGLAAARETARAAVLVVKADHVIGWRLTGFGARDAQPKSIDMPLKEAGVVGLAATSSRAVATREGDADGPGFEHLPADRKGLAMPVLVGGRVVAVLYGDSGTGPHEQVVPSTWPEVIEVLARHAGRCLEALTVQKAAAPSPRRAAATGTVTPAGTAG